jgi:hypothetical protein
MKTMILITCCFAATSIAVATDSKKYHEQDFAKNQLTDYKSTFADFRYSFKPDRVYSFDLYSRELPYEVLHTDDLDYTDFSRVLHSGTQAAQQEVYLCHSKNTRDTENLPMFTLSKEGQNTKLGVYPEQLLVPPKDTLLVLSFLLKNLDRSVLIGDKMLSNSDPSDTVAIKLKNHDETMIVNGKHPVSPNDKTQFYIVVVLLAGQRKLMLENDIEKISFKCNGTIYDYPVESENAGNLRHNSVSFPIFRTN